jgi:hypothetical protein
LLVPSPGLDVDLHKDRRAQTEARPDQSSLTLLSLSLTSGGLTYHPTSSPIMTSITQLLSPWPIVTKHSIVLREHYLPPPPPADHHDNMTQPTPSSPNDPSADGVTGSADSDGGDNNADGRKGYGKRELSTSKRAAQNRAAQVRGLLLPYCLLPLFFLTYF